MTKRIAVMSFMAIVPFISMAQVVLENEDQGVLLLEKGEKILFYQEEPKSLNGKYERRHYIHPLWSPGGTVMTEDFPSDHLHHRGIFWTWHQVWIDGERIGDPWEIKDFDQNVSELEFISDREGKGTLNLQVEWLSDKWKPQGVKIPYLQENTTITVHPKVKNYRQIDFKITLKALTDNLFIGGSEDEKGYSGFSVRMILPEDVIFEGADGRVEPKVIAVESPGYMNIYGTIEPVRKKQGIVIIDHPQNPGYPQKWILRKERSMQNIVFPGSGTVEVPIDAPLVLRYTLIVYTGKLKNKMIIKIKNTL